MRTEENDAIFHFVDNLNSIDTISELNKAFGSLIARFGFNRWACLQISTGVGKIREPLKRVFGNPSFAWLERYKKAGHIRNDVAAHQVMLRSEPFWWSSIIEETQLEKAQQLVFEEAREFGFNHGLAIPIRFPDGSVWSCLLTSEGLYETAEVKSAMFLAAQFYASKGMYLKDAQPINLDLRYKLTPRQREIVDYLRLGYKQTQISKILGISESTVNNLVNESKERMGTKTAAELVAEAILCGEILLG